MKKRAGVRFYVLGFMLLAASAFGADVIPDDKTFGEWRVDHINAAILQGNTNTTGVATNVADIAANAVANTATSNAFVAADAVVVAGYGSADTLVSNAFVSADTALSNVLASADSSIVSGYEADDTALSNALATAYGAADATVSNGLTTAYVAADTVVSNALVAAIGDPENYAAVSNAAMSATQPTDSVTTLSDVSNAGSGLIITAGERTTLGTALQPADSVTDLSDVTSVGSGAIITVAERAAIGAGATVPVSPAGLVSAYTLDGYLTNDWWGSVSLVNTNTGSSAGFDEVRGNYLEFDGLGDGPVERAAFNTSSNWTVALAFQIQTNQATFKYLLDAEITDGVLLYYYEVTREVSYRVDDGASTYSGNWILPAEDEGDWVHVAVTATDAGAVVFYANGAQRDTKSITTPIGLVETVMIGSTTGATNNACRVDDLFVWDRTLSSNEVVRLHALEASGQYGVQGLRRP